MTPTKIESRMYADSAGSINFFVGCNFDCAYCRPSFQRQMKRWGKNNCQDCYNYKPHSHLERLERSPPKTEDGQFIFFPSAGDWAFIPLDAWKVAIAYMKKYPDRLFLCQSKDPYPFAFREIVDPFPENAIIGTTIESNWDGIVMNYSQAPSTKLRYHAMMLVKHPRKMVTIEPIMTFDLEELASWVICINPWRVYIGYDSHPNENKLPEPPLAKTEELVKILRDNGLDVRTKLMRERQP